MTIDSIIMRSTGFVLDTGPNETAYLAGSGFFVFIEDEGQSYTYFLTAAHVVWPGRRQRRALCPVDDTNAISVNKKGGGVKKVHFKKSDWIFHPDRFVDLCAVHISDTSEVLHDECDIGVMNIQNLAVSATGPAIQTVQLMLGDPVFIAGAFGRRLGDRANIPIVRTGNVAALASEPVDFFSPRAPALLIETRSLGGISGSPVFFDPNTRLGSFGRSWGPVTVVNSATGIASLPTTLVPYRLVGMVLGTWGSNDPSDYLSDDERPLPVDAEWNSGISVVLTDLQISAFLTSTEVRQQRRPKAWDKEPGKPLGD